MGLAGLPRNRFVNSASRRLWELGSMADSVQRCARLDLSTDVEPLHRGSIRCGAASPGGEGVGGGAGFLPLQPFCQRVSSAVVLVDRRSTRHSVGGLCNSKFEALPRCREKISDLFSYSLRGHGRTGNFGDEEAFAHRALVTNSDWGGRERWKSPQGAKCIDLLVGNNVSQRMRGNWPTKILCGAAMGGTLACCGIERGCGMAKGRDDHF